MKDMLTLDSLCNGGVQERINRALAKISENILDPNTEAKKKRTLNLQITFVPKEDDREDVNVEVSTSVKLAPEASLATQLYISKNMSTGGMSITEHARGQIKGQLTLDDLGMMVSEPKPPTAEDLGCDPDTGEIIDETNSVVDIRKAMTG